MTENITESNASREDAESEAATKELLEIPGLLERVKQNQATPRTEYKSWRKLRSEVYPGETYNL